jgi:hypothetical protein
MKILMMPSFVLVAWASEFETSEVAVGTLVANHSQP